MSAPGLHVKQFLCVVFLLVVVAGQAFGRLVRVHHVSEDQRDDALGATGRALRQQGTRGLGGQPGRALPQPRHSNPYSKSWPNNIAICALMKDETMQDVKEFLEYHRWIGVDSFFIRENGDECKVREVLEPYERMGILNFALAPGPKYPLQTDWYNECASLAAARHNWIAFIDLDEFIVVLNKEKADTRQGALKKVTKSYFRYNAVVAMQWLLFGSDGHKTPPEEGQLQGFQKCTGIPSRQMKCFANVYWFHQSGVFQVDQVHQSVFRMGGVGVFGDGEPLPMSPVSSLPNNSTVNIKGAVSYPAHLISHYQDWHMEVTPAYKIIVNHYVTRAQNEFIERKIRLGGTGKFAQAFEEILNGLGDRDDVDEAYRRFEADFGFDGDHDICKQGAASELAMRRAIAGGQWGPVGRTPGLLAGGMARLLQG